MRKVGTALAVLSVVVMTMGLSGGTAHAATAEFAPPTDYPTGFSPNAAAVDDFNGDDVPDVVVANFDSDTVSVLVADGSGGFGATTDFATGSFPSSVAVGDLNGDGHSDLSVANYASSTVSVLLGDGIGGFGARTDFATDNSPWAVATGDMNSDGNLDVVVTVGSEVSAMLGDGDGNLVAHAGVIVGNSLASSVALADLNGDGRLDAVVAAVIVPPPSSPTVSVVLGDGTGGFGPPAGPFAGDSSAAAADVNGDGFIDLAVANSAEDSVMLWLGDGAGGFAISADVATGHHPMSVAVTDVNGDGLADLVSANYQSNSVSVLLGDGTGHFQAHIDATTGGSPVALVAGDFDRDGRVDLATANQSNSVTILLNTTPAPTAPDAPTIGSAIAGTASAFVSWNAPLGDGGSAVRGYVITPYIGYSPQPSTTLDSPAGSAVITGLTNGKQYRFRVQAVNVIGVGGFSKVTNPVVPTPTLPYAPPIGGAIAGDRSATVSWDPPWWDGGSPIIGYVVTPYIGYGPGTPRVYNSAATTVTVTGLKNGTTYRFRVQAVTAVGTGPYSTVTNPATPTP